MNTRLKHTETNCKENAVGDNAEKPPLAYGAVVAGRYQIVRLLGEGGMGAVYEATDKRLAKKVAIKVLKDEVSKRPGVIERFELEAKAAAGIHHHHVVDISDYGQDQESGLYYLCSEILVGCELLELIQRGELSLSMTFEVMRQVCSAMRAAHAKGVVHRDLKPENIFITKREGKLFAKVIDFGIAKDIEEKTRRTQTGVLMGTQDYMSPEQLMGQPIDARVDIYALGVILYEMITGAVPYQVPLTGLLFAIHKKARTILPDPELEEIVAKASHYSRQERYENIEELDQALAAYQRRHSLIPESSLVSSGNSSSARAGAPTPAEFAPPPPAIHGDTVHGVQPSPPPPEPMGARNPTQLEGWTTAERQAVGGSHHGRRHTAAWIGAGIAMVALLVIGGLTATTHKSAPLRPSAVRMTTSPAPSPVPTTVVVPEPIQPTTPPPSPEPVVVATEPSPPSPEPATNNHRERAPRHPARNAPHANTPLAPRCHQGPDGENICD